MTNQELLNGVLDGTNLEENQAYDLMQQFAASELDPAYAGALLAGLRAKGETAEEIRGFARAMRELAVKPDIPAGAPTVDTVGTGGDGSGSLNLSTGTGLLAAACGSRVVKHGNRSVSSKSGSADMLWSFSTSSTSSQAARKRSVLPNGRLISGTGWALPSAWSTRVWSGMSAKSFDRSPCQHTGDRRCHAAYDIRPADLAAKDAVCGPWDTRVCACAWAPAGRGRPAVRRANARRARPARAADDAR